MMYHCIYGPFLSRRLGLSLGIDLLADNECKICTFNCIYCEIGITKLKGYSSIKKRITLSNKFISILEKQLAHVLKVETLLDSITIGYNGEPTLISNLGDIIENIRRIRNSSNLKTPISIFTNSSTILDNNVCKSLDKSNNVIAKLDAGTQKIFHLINRPHYSVPNISKIIDGLTNYKKNYPNNKLIIQTMFINGKYSNIQNNNLKELAYAYKQINPDLIQIYSISRPPADVSVEKINFNQLIKIKSTILEYLNQDNKLNIKIY